MEWVCNNYETVSQTNWEHDTKRTFLVPIKLTEKNQTFAANCNRVALEVKHCDFNCESPQSTAEETAVRDQVIVDWRTKRSGSIKKIMGSRIIKQRGH